MLTTQQNLSLSLSLKLKEAQLERANFARVIKLQWGSEWRFKCQRTSMNCKFPFQFQRLERNWGKQAKIKTTFCKIEQWLRNKWEKTETDRLSVTETYLGQHCNWLRQNWLKTRKTAVAHWDKTEEYEADLFYSLEAEAELISVEERRDYSALNAVRLLCSDDTEAVSAEGLRGKWTEYMKCQGRTDYIHGVRLKSEAWKGWGNF